MSKGNHGAYCQCSAKTARGRQCENFGTINAADGIYSDPIWLCAYHFKRKDAHEQG